MRGYFLILVVLILVSILATTASPISMPSSETVWSIYYRGCIQWNMSQIPAGETVMDIHAVGAHFPDMLIAAGVDTSLGMFEWRKIHGVSPGTLKIVFSFPESSSHVESTDFTVALPIAQLENSCPVLTK